MISILAKARALLPDAAVAAGLRELFNRRFKAVGEMTVLQLDAVKKTAACELQLAGEAELLKITVDRYEVLTSGDKTHLVILEIRTSRPWINSIIAELLQREALKIEIPKAARALL